MSSQTAAVSGKRRPRELAPQHQMHHAHTEFGKIAPLYLVGRFQTYLALTSIFIVWKLLLLIVVLTTPTDGPGYDTSADLFFETDAVLHNTIGQGDAAAANLAAILPTSSIVSRITTRLTRWDAIYMISAAWKGYLHEQDWAFSFGYTAIVDWSSKAFSFCQDEVANVVMHGVVITNLCHLLSVLVLFELTSLSNSSHRYNRQVAFVAAALHILSPAGVFLLAPYSEAPFACLNFLGSYFYARGVLQDFPKNSRMWKDAHIIAAGLTFGLAAMVRSNGLFAGIIFACDALAWAVSKVFNTKPFVMMVLQSLPSIWSTMIAGTLVGVGFIIPQAMAYREFCMRNLPADRPPWCKAFPPSITTYIQAHYWNVGLFRYWTVSNIPLFLLAAPMLYVLLITSFKVFQYSTPRNQMEKSLTFITCRLALPQVATAVLTLTTAHVQIVNRLSSGYPVWLMYLAKTVVSFDPKEQGWAKFIVRLMVVYGVVQAVLFSAFLPPA